MNWTKLSLTTMWVFFLDGVDNLSYRLVTLLMVLTNLRMIRGNNMVSIRLMLFQYNLLFWNKLCVVYSMTFWDAPRIAIILKYARAPHNAAKLNTALPRLMQFALVAKFVSVVLRHIIM